MTQLHKKSALRSGLAVLIGGLLIYTYIAPASVLDSTEWPKTDFSQAIVDPEEIISGGPPKDGIPAIDQPKFVSFKIADQWLATREPVIVVEINGQSRAYPIQILIYHEIVNDQLAGVPISVTFCPLCNAGLVFDRRLDGKTLDFGTTGRLRLSDLVMYDRQTETWWQQFLGQGLIGTYAGKLLRQLPASMVAYGEYKSHFPHGEVLSRETGYSRPYGKNPYRGYDHIDQQPFLYFDPLDPRLPAMERVIGVQFEDQAVIYPLSLLEKIPLIHDRIKEESIVVFGQSKMASPLDKAEIRRSRSIPAAKAYFRRLQGRILNFKADAKGIFDTETGSRWSIFGKALSGPLIGQQLDSADSGVHFAFAWLAFRPNSRIYQENPGQENPVKKKSPARRTIQ